MVSRLPNAPLTEVVFEMRWGVAQAPEIPTPFSPDPGYPSILDTFTGFARQNGFEGHADVQGPVYGGAAHSVSRRFYQGGENFPLLQIGPGIFAANDSSQYEWKAFREMAENGAANIVRSYPKFKEFAFEIKHLELRYIDVFEEDVIGSVNFVDFIERATNMKLGLSPFMAKPSVFGRDKRVRVQFDADIKGMANTNFVFDLGTAKQSDTPVIRLETKVVTRADQVISVRQPRAFPTKLRTWLENAHDVVSPFFKDFVRQDVLSSFK